MGNAGILSSTVGSLFRPHKAVRHPNAKDPKRGPSSENCPCEFEVRTFWKHLDNIHSRSRRHKLPKPLNLNPPQLFASMLFARPLHANPKPLTLPSSTFCLEASCGRTTTYKPKTSPKPSTSPHLSLKAFLWREDFLQTLYPRPYTPQNPSAF